MLAKPNGQWVEIVRLRSRAYSVVDSLSAVLYRSGEAGDDDYYI